MDKGNLGGVQILMNSYNIIGTLAQRFHLKLNIIPTLFGSFEPKPMYLRTDPITERVVTSLLPQDQVRAFIDMCHEYNIKRQDTSHLFKSKNQSGVLVPILVTKTQNDPNENQCKLDFFSNSAYETFNRTFGKSYMVFQRYVPCKGSNANVVRCIYHKDHMQKKVYRLQSKMKMNGTTDTTDEENKRDASPTKKSAAAAQAEALYMTKDKVLGYAKDIIKSIKERLEQLDDPNASPLDFGVEQIFLSPTVQA